MNRTEQRLQRAVQARLEPDEHLVAWTHAWVSRYRRFHLLLALRNRDFAVVTNRRLMLWSTGFFTRRPKRRVLSDRLDELSIASTSRDPGRRMACSRVGRPALLLELGKDPQSDHFSIELRDRALAAKALHRTEPADASARARATPRQETPRSEFGLFAGPAPEPARDPDADAAADALDEPREAAAVDDAPGAAAGDAGDDGETAPERGTERDAETDAETETETETDASAPPSDLRPWP
jgi:hypothetical protein